MKQYFCLLVFGIHILSAQDRSIHGIIRDGSNNEPLPYVNILIVGTTTGTSSDDNGKFLLKYSGDSLRVQCSLIGYKTEVVSIQLSGSDQPVTIKLYQTDVLLQEVTVYSSVHSSVELIDVSSVSLQSKNIKDITAVFPDMYRSIQSLPGINVNNELSAKFNVRGGNQDENLVLVNSAQVYEPFHVKEADNASIGIFNVDLMRKVDLITGGFSARYGDRLSSVLNIEYREGNREKTEGSASLGFTNVDALIEGPFGDGGSYIIGGRKSYFEYILNLLDVAPEVHVSFYDIQGVLSHPISHNSKLIFEFIHAGDTYQADPKTDIIGPTTKSGTAFGQSSEITQKEKNYEKEQATYYSNLFDVQSRTILSPTVLLNGRISYYLQIENEWEHKTQERSVDARGNKNYFYYSNDRDSLDRQLRIKTIEAAPSLDVQINPYYEIKTGMSYQDITYQRDNFDIYYLREIKNTVSYPDTSIAVPFDVLEIEHTNTRSYKFAAFIENILQVTDAFILNLGVRSDYFDFNKELTLSPRISASYRITAGTTLRAAWGVYYQSPIYRQIAYATASDTNTKAQRAFHYILGGEQQLYHDDIDNRSLTLKIEGYVKKYDNVISSIKNSEGNISYSGKNDSKAIVKGFDCYLSLSIPGFYGWLSYGLLYAEEDLLTDNIGAFPRYTDQRHTLSLVGSVELGKHWSMNSRVQYGSGYAVTPFVSQFDAAAKKWSWVPGPINSEHLPAYSRIDLRVSNEFVFSDLPVSAFLDISNVLNTKNVISYDYRFDEYGNPYRQEMELFPIIPTLGLTVRF